MGWWVFGDGGDGGNVGCFPRIGRKQARNSYAFPADPGSGTFSDQYSFRSRISLVTLLFLFALIVWPLRF
jgi:hypothetical protein